MFRNLHSPRPFLEVSACQPALARCLQRSQKRKKDLHRGSPVIGSALMFTQKGADHSQESTFSI